MDDFPASSLGTCPDSQRDSSPFSLVLLLSSSMQKQTSRGSERNEGDFQGQEGGEEGVGYLKLHGLNTDRVIQHDRRISSHFL